MHTSAALQGSLLQKIKSPALATREKFCYFKKNWGGPQTVFTLSSCCSGLGIVLCDLAVSISGDHSIALSEM